VSTMSTASASKQRPLATTRRQNFNLLTATTRLTKSLLRSVQSQVGRRGRSLIKTGTRRTGPDNVAKIDGGVGSHRHQPTATRTSSDWPPQCGTGTAPTGCRAPFISIDSGHSALEDLLETVSGARAAAGSAPTSTTTPQTGCFPKMVSAH
jgi:hypothetical protein